jgi:lipoprotein-anchoring transpeptidase ErfK/SrfK
MRRQGYYSAFAVLAAVLPGISSAPMSVGAPSHDAQSRPHAEYEVVKVRRGLNLRAGPDRGAIAAVATRTEFGSPQVLGVAAREGRWLGVVTSDLPDGKLGWLESGSPAIKSKRTPLAIRVDLSKKTLDLVDNGRTVRRAKVAIGSASSPTPTGRFAVTDKLPGARFSPSYGCCILALSGHQTRTPAGWRGGNRLAIHGTPGDDTIGTASSAGCVRARRGDLKLLMRRVPLGTPVFVRR